MNIFTFKNIAYAFIAVFAVQTFSFAQLEEQPNTARDGNTYRIKNKATGKYLAYGEDANFEMNLIPVDFNSADTTQVWEFKSNTVAVDGSTFYTIDMGGTLEGTRGILRIAGSGAGFQVFSTTKKSSDTSGISDKVQNVHELGNEEIRIQAKTANSFLRENTPAEVTAGTHVAIYTGPELDENDDRQVWVLEDGTLGEEQVVLTEGVKYNLKNLSTGEYLKATGDGAYEFASELGAAENFNFTFWHHNTVNNNGTPDDTSDDVAYNYTDDWNIQGDVRGIMRGAGDGAVVHTTFQYNTWNSNGGHKTDKRWVATSSEVNGTNVYRFQIVSSVGEGKDPRFLYQEASWEVLNVAVSAMADENKSYWILEESTLSNERLNAASVFMSNPVKDNVSITGLTSEINQIHVYSLLGAKVLSQEVNNAASLQMNVSGLSKGMYIVDFVGENGNFTKKLIKE